MTYLKTEFYSIEVNRLRVFYVLESLSVWVNPYLFSLLQRLLNILLSHALDAQMLKL